MTIAGNAWEREAMTPISAMEARAMRKVDVGLRSKLLKVTIRARE